jgi:excisionase family DNA binding protein
MPAVDTLTPGDGGQTRTVTLAQAAQILGVSVPTVRRRVKQGTLPATKIEGPNGPEYRVESRRVSSTLPWSATALRTLPTATVRTVRVAGASRVTTGST